MACDCCGKKGCQLVDLLDEYKTDDVKQVCDECRKVIDDHLWKVRIMATKMTTTLTKRFIDALFRRNK